MGSFIRCCCKDEESKSSNEKNEKLIQSTESVGKWKISEKDFKVLRLIGKGNFGKVFLVQKESNGMFFAMKVLKKKEKDSNQKLHTITEKNILLKVQSPFIVELKYCFQDFKKLYIVMEFIQGGELFFHIRKTGRFTEDRAQFYIAEIILALEFLHNNGVIYRDLKPEKILLGQDGHIKLADFGLSKIGIDESNPKAYTFCGTAEYLAPEIIKNQGYDKAVDF